MSRNSIREFNDCYVRIFALHLLQANAPRISLNARQGIAGKATKSLAIDGFNSMELSVREVCNDPFASTPMY